MSDLDRPEDVAVAARLADDEVLSGYFAEAFAAVREQADPARLAEMRGVAGFEVSRPGAVPTTHLVSFDGAGGVEIVGGVAPDVTIGLTAVQLVRLLSGTASAALLYLADELTLKGDELLALAVGSVIALPGEGVAVDPTALDPVDVSRAIKDVSTAHLHEVMGGALREVVVGEVFRRLPDYMIERKAANLDLAVGFRIEASNGRPAERFLVEVRRGTCVVTRDPAEDVRRDVTLLLDGPGFLRLVLGHVNPVRAVMSGRLKLKGDPAKALAFNAVMRIPKP